MISFEEAYKIVMASAKTTGAERIPFTNASGRILAEDVFSDTDMPPFNRSAVDGYACKTADLGMDLEMMEVVAAGREPLTEVGTGQCSKIMTGAIVPEGCDIVFMVEDSEVMPSGKIRFTGTSLKPNISIQGEDVKKGQLVLEKGKHILPQDIAVIASFGHVSVLVSKKPGVAVISTGDEIIEPENKPARSQIRNSNAYQLLAQTEAAGGRGKYYGIAPDTGDTAFEIISRALSENDIVVLTGGVSMGDFDFIPSFLARAGVKILFNRINVQPGKPTTFGIHPKAIVFGLPGNPVSSFIQFETLIKPVIRKMSESNQKQYSFELPLGVKYERKSASRMGWIPVRLSAKNEVIPVEYHGSAHITSLSYSDGIISIMPEVTSLEKGTLVTYRPF
ncbi:MAG: gephyrin-like molybdotransferase Glp [Chloroflexota bacterium]